MTEYILTCKSCLSPYFEVQQDTGASDKCYLVCKNCGATVHLLNDLEMEHFTKVRQ